MTTRRLFLAHAAAAALSPGFAHAQNDAPRPASPFDAAEIKATELAPGLYELTGVGGNMGLFLSAAGPLLIDCQFAPLAAKIKAKVAALSGGAKVETLINTHWHADHTNGNPAFGAEGARIIAHEKAAARLAQTQASTLFGRETPPLPPEGLPGVFVPDAGLSLERDGETLEIRHYPSAHTDGDLTIYFRNRDVLHIGDLLFNGFFPFIDIDTGGTVDGYIAAQAAALDLIGPNTKIISGHGPLADRAALARNLAALREVRARVAALLAKGLTLDDAIAAKPLADLDDPWGKFFITADKMTEIVFKDLSRRA